MKCTKCGDLGFYPVANNGKISVEDCSAPICVKRRDERRNRKPKSLSLRKIYESAEAFMEYESKMQFELDYPTIEEFLKANGTKSI